MASLFKRGDFLYLAFYDIVGKQHQRSLKIPATQIGWRQAREIKKHVEANMRRDPWGFAKQIRLTTSTERVSKLFQRVLDLGYRRTRSVSTVKLVDLSLKKFTTIMGDLPVSHLSPVTMIQFREKIIPKDGEQNVAIWLRTLGGVFSYAVRFGLLPSNPVTAEVRLKPTPRPPVAMTIVEVERFFKQAELMHKPGFVRQCRFLYYTGFRAGDSCDFRRSDIDFEAGIILYRNKKAKTVTPFPIYSALVPILEPARPLEPAEFVFAHQSKHTLSHYFRRVMDELKMSKDYTLHTLKSSYITRLANAGVRPALLQQLAHHADYRTTDRFYIARQMDALREELERGSLTVSRAEEGHPS
jgi:integrase